MTASALDALADQHLGDTPGGHRAACPVCAKAGRDDAVNITIKPDGSVVAHCHRCGENGTARPDRANGARRPAARARHARPAEDFKALWNSGAEPGEIYEHPYLERKQVEAHGIRVAGELLLIPLRNVAGELAGVQTIDADGTKLYRQGTRKTGAYHLIGKPDDRVVIAEGYATGMTIHEGTGGAVAVAFDAGNLIHVAKALHTKYPTTTIVIAADDDIATGGNPGLTAATAAARAVGGLVAVPDFGADRPEKASDFNDLAGHRGPEAVQQCILRAKAPEVDAESERQPDDDALLYQFAHELGEAGDEADELIEGLLTCEGGGVVYGDSNSGKTFLVIDLGAAVARETVWMGRHVEPALVVYLATESPASVRRRLRAYQRHHGCKVPNFAIVQSPIDLYNGAADTERVIELVQTLKRKLDVKRTLIIGDTLSRLTAGANENSGEDMSIVVRHVDRIRHECGAHFLLVHHCGKDAARGMRGWSGMRAAIDTEIEVTADADAGTHAAEITKQRDIPGKGTRIGFRLQVIDMGIGKWGNPITSCVVVNAEAPAKQAPGKRPSEIAGAIAEFLTTRGSGIKKRDLVDHFDGRYTSGAVYRELKKMAEAKKLHEVCGIVALAGSQ